MQQKDQKQLFNFMLERVKDTSQQSRLPEPQAFVRWFADMYFSDPHDGFVTDGAGDGKVDLFFTTHNGRVVEHHIVNSKFTSEYNKTAPAKFYEELTYFWHAFENKDNRDTFLSNNVRRELRDHYRKLFGHYDEERAQLIFLTNHRRNDARYESVRYLESDGERVKIFHLEDLIQHLIDDLDAAMPRTSELRLTGIHQVLTPAREDTKVPTSIVFARLADFIEYMDKDPNDLLFARNVRLDLKDTEVNKEIKKTFSEHPTEFAFSHNGITLLCEAQSHMPGAQELVLYNPRVVNGSQTLHSIRDVHPYSHNARVMVRIIEIPPVQGDDLPVKIDERKNIINKISERSNRQNKIEKWNLVANDDFQLEIYRHFRRKGLFYERRQNEWRKRSSQLKSVGIGRGPSLKKLAQKIAAYHWNKKRLGPANAKVSGGELFARDAYPDIRATPVEVVYQIYLLAKIIDDAYRDLPQSPKYLRYMKGHVDLALMTLLVKAFKEAEVQWGRAEFTRFMEEQLNASGRGWQNWKRLVKDSITHIYTYYTKEDKAHRKQEGFPLTLNNYFKSHARVGKVFDRPTPSKLVSLARQLLKSK